MDYLTVKGAGGIEAKMILDSINQDGIRLTTIQTKAPKFLDAQFEKHRALSSNSSSDRAIPFKRVLENGYYLPPDVRLNEPGMQGYTQMDGDEKEEFYQCLKDIYGYTSEKLKQWDKVHKQHINRYLMGFTWQNKISTGTEWSNFFAMRLNDADPSMMELARCMKEVMDKSEPKLIKHGEWHLPYIEPGEFTMSMFANKDDLYETAIKCSVARNARVSYNNHNGTDTDIQKDIGLADRLLKDGHMSPFEHVATPMKYTSEDDHLYLYNDDGPIDWEKGITHVSRGNDFWSGNFRGFIQYRQLL